jgi:uncharacterized repeat protein (TIGR02543 family)
MKKFKLSWKKFCLMFVILGFGFLPMINGTVHAAVLSGLKIKTFCGGSASVNSFYPGDQVFVEVSQFTPGVYNFRYEPFPGNSVGQIFNGSQGTITFVEGGPTCVSAGFIPAAPPTNGDVRYLLVIDADKNGFDPQDEAGRLNIYDREDPIYHYVTYEGNGNTGGTAPIDNTQYQAGNTVTVLGSGTLVRAGYTFAGWNTAPDGNGTSYAAGNTFPMPSANVTLYARWTAMSGTAIPTLSEWGMIIMSLLLAGSAVWMIRRRRMV